MTNKIIEQAARGININLREQLNGKPNPPENLWDETSWKATGGEIDLTSIAQAALDAAGVLILDKDDEPIVGDSIESGIYVGFISLGNKFVSNGGILSIPADYKIISRIGYKAVIHLTGE